MKAFLLSLAALLFSSPVLTGEAFPGMDTQKLCLLMRSEGFSGPKKWRNQGNGVWGCTTARKKLVQGDPAGASDVRYRGMGSDSQPRTLRLELRMRSYRGPQGVLEKFHEYARTMTEKATGHSLPSRTREAFLSAIEGEWEAEGYRFRLEKRFSRGSTYDLWFTVEPSTGEELFPAEKGE